MSKLIWKPTGEELQTGVLSTLPSRTVHMLEVGCGTLAVLENDQGFLAYIAHGESILCKVTKVESPQDALDTLAQQLRNCVKFFLPYD